VSRFLESHLDIDWENSDDVSERLSWSEFGYRSIHYVVSLRRTDDLLPVDDDLYGFECQSPECPGFGTFHPFKAEIQVRTLAEHAWADFAHDITYKGAFQLPAQWLREIALMAADLEDVDRTVARIEEGLRTYAASYGSYMEPEELIAEIQTLETVLSFDPDNAHLAWRIGKLAMTAGDWDRAVAVMDRFVDPHHPDLALQPLLRDLGVSLRKSGDVARGRRYLEAAVDLDPTDSDAIASLAGSWRGDDDARAHGLYRRAFEVDPTDYYPLLNYVDGEIERTGATGILEILAPMASQAMARCRAHVDVGINIPWSLSSLAKFHLLLGDPYAALEWYALAIRAGTSVYAVPTLERTRVAASQIRGHDWCDRFLQVAGAARFGDEAARSGVAALATAGAPPIEPPVLIVVGSTDPRLAEQTDGYRRVIAEAVAGCRGTVISGGTRQGVCGLVGEAAAASEGRVRAIGYLPADLPADAEPDDRYDELRTTAGEGFSPLDPLQNWIDLVASGVDPSEVVVLGLGGGQIAAAEYRIALALGARVGIVEGSGREASRLLADPRWNDAGGPVPLPADPHTVRAFVSSPSPSLGSADREALARELHRAYREEIAATQADDPARLPWETLADDLKQSNLDQVDDIVAKLGEIGCRVVPSIEGAAGFAFTDEEVDRLGEMEHGRWAAERLRAGWRWGPARDPAARRSPYLVAWAQVPDEIREYDRQFVRRIPALLASVGLGIVRAG
ncbi:MAG: hypothetical protein KJ956_04835, partial [Actinobacteria bacterium]|nr:hypothetical protein [Actinomycetota bacterium]